MHAHREMVFAGKFVRFFVGNIKPEVDTVCWITNPYAKGLEYAGGRW